MTTSQPLRIVVGVDGSEPSLEALRVAAEQCRLLGARLQVVTVWDFPTATGQPVPLPLEFNPAAIAHEAAAGALAKVLGSESDLATETVVVEGRPHDVLVDQARHARMLVVGRSGHGWFDGMHLGSVSESCVRRATCPVLVVPAVTADAA